MNSNFIKLSGWVAGLIFVGVVTLPMGGCAAPNHVPSITSLKSEKNLMLPWDTCQVECIALDEDGDDLSYEWTTDEGEIYGEGASISWGSPSTEGIFHIDVRVTDDRGGEADDSITITVRENDSPDITRLAADADWVVPAASSRIECDAEDSDGDELSYAWSATGGDISGTGPVVTWTAPETQGIYDITVVVRDTMAGEVRRKLSISATFNPPPAIKSLIVTCEEPRYVREYGQESPDVYKVYRGQTYSIECILAEPNSELTYQWSADEGEISGTGRIAKWIAPPHRVEVTVTVIVSDAAGNEASKNIVCKVETCLCAFR